MKPRYAYLTVFADQRWFMFQNMGPSPSGRSGHAMATAGSRVFVLGGESFSAPKVDDPMLVHVLDASASFPAVFLTNPCTASD
jgi:hypothetical protein